jgi:hypothetical protein
MESVDLFEQSVREAVKNGSNILPPPFLAGQILSAIAKKRRFYALIKLAVCSFFSLASTASSLVVLRLEWPNMINSEARQLLSLLFSDFTLIAQYWREYLWSVLESLPMVSIMFMAGFIWITVVSLLMAARAYLNFTRYRVKQI